MIHLFSVLILLFAGQAHALDWHESPAIAKLFTDAGMPGTFVLYDVDEARLTGCDQGRAETRFVPASTFKIANSLIGLSLGAVSDVDEALPYGGKPLANPAWEKDMGLREAIKLSNVPIYQELARRIGLERMRRSVAELDYGNGEIGDLVDRFWLDGPLKISAVEQTLFLARLARDKLPFSEAIQAQVREILELERGKDWILYGKTGWLNAPNPGLGWWVGWLNKDGRLYSFALNIDMNQASDAAKRIALGKAALQSLGLI